MPTASSINVYVIDASCEEMASLTLAHAGTERSTIRHHLFGLFFFVLLQMD